MPLRTVASVFKKQKLPIQQELWVRADELPVPASSPFYEQLDRFLESVNFEEKARALCAPYYKPSGPGQPGVDPVVYFKMILIGFFEGIKSERGIESRCGDSLMLRRFLGFEIIERVPDHSTLSVIRRRLPVNVFKEVFGLMHPALAKMGLIRGKNVGADTSVIEANASMRRLTNRLTGQKYRAYVVRLAKTAGVDEKDSDAVTRFDRNRKKKVSNDDWMNPHDPDAKIGLSGQRFAYSFLQIPPRDGHPCRSANDFPCRVRRGLAPPSGHTKQAAPCGAGPLSYD